MALATRKKKKSFSKKISRISQILKQSFTGIGFVSVAVIALFTFDSNARDHAVNSISNWANTSKSEHTFPLAPFDLEKHELIEYSNSPIAQGYTKVPVATISSLPVLELNELTEDQLKITNFLANRYRVAPQAIALLVKEAWIIGEEKNLDPTLLLAIAAIESRFNPFAQSEVGATGLMQIMTNIHATKLERAGGAITVFDPVTNLRVGAQILEEHVKRAGSLEGGLKQYVGATGPNDYGYGKKVTGERDRIRRVVFGYTTPTLDAILAIGKDQAEKQENLESA